MPHKQLQKQIYNDVELIGDMVVTGDTTLTGATTQTGAFTVAGALIGSTTLAVTGASTLTGDVTVTGVLKVAQTAITATSDGLTTGLIAAGVGSVLITSTTNDIIRPPVGVAGDVIHGYVGANGCEIRTILGNSGKINDVVCEDTKEAAIPADTTFTLHCKVAEEWTLIAYTKLGAVVAAIVPDAV